MNRNHIAIVALVVSILVGGCVGLEQNDPLTTDSFDYPPGYNESGITNATVAVETHESALDEPFRINFSLSQVSVRGNSKVNGAIVAAPEDNVALLQTEVTVGGQKSTLNEFRTADTVFQQQVSGHSFDYYVLNRSYQRPVYPERDEFVTMIGALRLNESSVFEAKGSQFVQYSIVEVVPTRIQTEIEDANGTVVVGSEGQIHSINVTFLQRVSGVEREVTFTYKVTKGNVTVERPEWVETAKNQTYTDTTTNG